jgi:hypothetical protein
VCTLVAFGFVLAFGSNAPYADEGEFVPVLVGDEPVGPWFWQQHNEHRLPLPRVAYYGLFRLTHDFRAGMYLQVAMLSALALGLMRVAEELRGRPEWTDLFFPLSLLHLGHWENFIMGYQVFFVLFTVLVSGLAVVATRATRESAFRSGLLAAVLLAALALSGGSGLALVPPVAAWVVYLAGLVWRDGEKGKAFGLAGLAALPVAYLALYFVGYHRPPGHPEPSRDPLAVAQVTGVVMSLGVGIGVSKAWWAVAAGELLLGLATVVFLLRRPRAERLAALGLIAVAAGVFGLALTIGSARGDWDLERVLWWSRYSLLAWPLLGAAYLAWAKAGRKWMPAALCLLAAVAYPPNTGTGMQIGHGIREHYRQLEADSRAGRSAEEMIRERFPNSPNSQVTEWAREGIPLLRAANVGTFAERDAGFDPDPWWLAGFALVLGAVVLRWFWHLLRAVLAERARELFRLQHERFEEQLLRAASATGLPRGLRWVRCRISGDAVLARDAAARRVVALVPVVIEFEPEEGSDMADNPAAREPRPATAVFTFHRGTWETAGRVVFNHTPEQTVAAFAPQFRVIPLGHH